MFDNWACFSELSKRTTLVTLLLLLLLLHTRAHTKTHAPSSDQLTAQAHSTELASSHLT